MTWMTPFDCLTSAIVILALSPLPSTTHQPPALSPISVMCSPSTVLRSSLPPSAFASLAIFAAE